MFSILFVVFHQIALGLILTFEVTVEGLRPFGLFLAQVSQLEHFPPQFPFIPLVIFVDLTLFIHFYCSLNAFVDFVDFSNVEERFDRAIGTPNNILHRGTRKVVMYLEQMD